MDENQLAGAFQTPAILNALQSRLGQLVGTSSGYIESLPLPVRRRIDALKNLQDQSLAIDAKFRLEVQALERKFLVLHQPLYTQRALIIKGTKEPTDQESARPVDDEQPKIQVRFL